MKFKKLFYLIGVLAVISCDTNHNDPDKIILENESRIFLFAVDYMTNNLCGSFQISLPHYIEDFEMVCDYKPPGDFGSIAWYEKSTLTTLFAGTIIWMGKGERTFPPNWNRSVNKQKKAAPMPAFIQLQHDKYQISDAEIRYNEIWDAIKYDQCVNWLVESSKAYIYLYQPSIGIGNPADCYWLIFLKY